MPALVEGHPVIPALVVAGAASGVGKTTITLGLLEVLRRRGLVVQPFKVGPDFIDPGFHALVAGRPSHNLDGWLCSRDFVRDTVARQAAGADLALIEGVMGCFDGHGATSDEGSTAEIAKWLGAPVVLVVDASAMARSAGAIVLGFERFDPGLDLAGVVFNRVAGETHWQWLREAVSARCRAVPLGYLPQRDSLTLPERHLGLVTAAEHGLPRSILDGLCEAIEASVDVDRLLALARSDVEPDVVGLRPARGEPWRGGPDPDRRRPGSRLPVLLPGEPRSPAGGRRGAGLLEPAGRPGAARRGRALPGWRLPRGARGPSLRERPDA